MTTSELPRIPQTGTIEFIELYKENPRQRNYREREQHAAVHVTLPAADAADAPLLLTGPADTNTRSTRVPYRRLGDQVYRQMQGDPSPSHDRHGHKTVLRPMTMAVLLRDHFRTLMNYEERKATGAQALTPLLQQKLDRAGYLLIEGAIYEPCGEPVYVANVSYSYQSIEIGFLNNNGTVNTYRDDRDLTLFRADALEEAKAYLRRGKDVYIGEPDIVYEQVNSDLLRYGILRDFEVDLEFTMNVTLPVRATSASDARQRATEHAKNLYAPLSTGAIYPRRRDSSSGTRLTERPSGDMSLALPGFTVQISGQTLRTVTDGDAAEITVDVPEHTHAAVLAATALLIHADRSLTLNAADRISQLSGLNPDAAGDLILSPADHLGLLGGLTADTAEQLNTLFGARPLSLAQRAVRGVLSDAATAAFTAQVERLLLTPPTAAQAAD